MCQPSNEIILKIGKPLAIDAASPIWADWLGFFMRTIFQDLPTFWRFFQTLKVRICWKSRKFFPNPQNDHQKQKQHKFTAFWQIWMITRSLTNGNLHRKWLNVIRLFHVPSSPYHATKTPLLMGLPFKKTPEAPEIRARRASGDLQGSGSWNGSNSW